VFEFYPAYPGCRAVGICNLLLVFGDLRLAPLDVYPMGLVRVRLNIPIDLIKPFYTINMSGNFY